MTPRTPIHIPLLVALAALAALSACTSPPLPPPPPVVALAPAEGAVLVVDAYRVPEGQSWESIAADCAAGVRVAGDIALVDRRAEPGAAGGPCFRMAGTNGLPYRWEGCGLVRYPDDPRIRRYELTGVWAARALVGARTGRGGGLEQLIDAGWLDVAVTYAERRWLWATDAGLYSDPLLIMEVAMRRLPRDRQVQLHGALVTQVLDQARSGAAEGDRRRTHLAAMKLNDLGRALPAGADASAFVRRVRESGALDAETLATLVRALRPVLVAQRAYADALEGDTDPVGHFVDQTFWLGMATGMFALVPSAVIPAPSEATSADKAAVKEGALEGVREMERLKGLQLYEALVGTGRTADAERLKRELQSRYQVPTIPQGTTPEDVALRRVFADALPPGDLEARLRAAEERAQGRDQGQDHGQGGAGR